MRWRKRWAVFTPAISEQRDLVLCVLLAPPPVLSRYFSLASTLLEKAASAAVLKTFDESPFDEGVVRTEVAVRPFNRRSHRRKTVRLTIFQIDEVQNLLRAVWQKHEDELLGSLRENKYQFGAGLMTAASPASETLGAFSTRSKSEHYGKERILKKKFCSLLSMVVPAVLAV